MEIFSTMGSLVDRPGLWMPRSQPLLLSLCITDSVHILPKTPKSFESVLWDQSHRSNAVRCWRLGGGGGGVEIPVYPSWLPVGLTWMESVGVRWMESVGVIWMESVGVRWMESEWNRMESDGGRMESDGVGMESEWTPNVVSMSPVELEWESGLIICKGYFWQKCWEDARIERS